MSEDGLVILLVFVRILFPSIVATQYYALFGHVLFRVPYRKKRVLPATMVLFAATVLRGINFGGSLSMVFIAVAMIGIAFILWLPMDRIQFAICLVSCFVSEFLLENLSITLYILLGGYYYEQTLWGFLVYVLDPPTIPLYLATTLITFTVPVLIAYMIKNRRRRTPMLALWASSRYP